MITIIDAIQDNLLLIVLFIISIFLIVLKWQKERIDMLSTVHEAQTQILRVRRLREVDKNTDPSSPIRLLLQREDVNLRVLEEVYEPHPALYSPDWGSLESLRLSSLYNIQSELRKYLRVSLESADFPKIRDRTLAILDQIRLEIEKLEHKQPFNEISDPEKSLLIDIFQEIDPTHTIAKQKMLQLANIIKIKHQDLINLASENAKAAVWTKWGTAGTIIFGVLSLIMAIIAFMN